MRLPNHIYTYPIDPIGLLRGEMRALIATVGLWVSDSHFAYRVRIPPIRIVAFV